MSELNAARELARKIILGLDFTMKREAEKKATVQMVLRAYRELAASVEIERMVREDASPAVAEALDQLDAPAL